MYKGDEGDVVRGGRVSSALLGAGALALSLLGCLAETSDSADGADELATHSEELVGNQYVSAESALGHWSWREVTATCPVGKVVYGAGFTQQLDTGTLADGDLKYFAPSADGSSWTARVRAPVGYRGVWRLKVIATCAAPVAGYRIKTTDVAHSTSTRITATAACGQAQKVPTVRAMGGGFGLFDTGGAVLEPSLSALPATGLSRSVTALNATGQAGTLRAYAICVSASAVEAYDVIATSEAWPSGTTTPESVSDVCASGSWALSAGYQLFDQADRELPSNLRESRNVRGRSGTYGWLSSVYRAIPSVPSKQVPTTLKQVLVCVKDLPG